MVVSKKILTLYVALKYYFLNYATYLKLITHPNMHIFKLKFLSLDNDKFKLIYEEWVKKKPL